MTNTTIHPYYIIIIVVTLFLIPFAQIHQESLSLLHTISSSIRDRAPEVSASIRSNQRDSHVFDVGKYTQIYSLATKYIPNERLARGQTGEEGGISLFCR